MRGPLEPSSRSSILVFSCFAFVYLADGALTWVALSLGVAREGNSLARSFTPHGILLAKFLGLLAVVALAALVAWVEPRAKPGLAGMWRAGSGIFGAVCLWNVGVILGGVA